LHKLENVGNTAHFSCEYCDAKESGVTNPHAGTWVSAALLKSWDDYVAASQALLERLKSPAAGGATISLPFFGAWQEFAKSMGMNSDFTGGATFKPEEMIASMAPALGITREYQTIVQRMAELGLQFQTRYAEFLKQSAGIGEQALQAVRKRAAAEPAIAASPATAYEAWIDSAETAYSQTAHSDEFARSLGELCNLLSAFKVERGKLLEAFARHLDLPSRAEVDSLHRKVHDMRSAARGAASTPSTKKPRARTPRKRAGK
jgi:class III poly(R)-hydroxyalkanoic acid synthase PhaE subunit